jgi:hypothetical protein
MRESGTTLVVRRKTALLVFRRVHPEGKLARPPGRKLAIH